ncbi:ATP-binding protein [Prescottella subtropica]|uniref:ATP-binding protein n=1 Tax=Prescottella subtropica TaxID=2545757 RepID=UPI0019D548E9|nr:AAA family ATPase [Prescottella subtropica]
MASAFGTRDQFDAGTVVVREVDPEERDVAGHFERLFRAHCDTAAHGHRELIHPPRVCHTTVPGNRPLNPLELFAALATSPAGPALDPLTAAVDALAHDQHVVPGISAPQSGVAIADRVLAAVPAEDADGVLLADGRRYLPRSIAGQPDYLILRKLRGQMNVRLKGVPGGGKTTLPAAAFGADLITVQGHRDLTMSSLAGQYQPHPDGSFVWHDGPLTRALKEGKVLLVDEINRAPSGTIAALLSVADSRGQLVLDDRPDMPPVVAAPGFSLIITYNEEGQGVRPLDDAIKRRFPFEVTVETDYDVADRAGIDARLVKIGRHLLSHHRESIADGGLPVWRPQMADLEAAQHLLDAGLGIEITAATVVSACTNDDDVDLVAQTVERVFGLADVRPLQLGGAL